MKWDALAARARGLAVHRLGAGELEALAEARDLRDIAGRLAAAGYPVARHPATARGMERAVRQRAAADLRILARWTGGGSSPALAAVAVDQDRLSLRALLRGIVAGAPLEDRLAAAVPTLDLSAARLAELARQTSPAAVVELLIRWRNPFGWALGGETARTQPSLFALERAIDRCFAARALEAAGADGPAVAELVAHVLDAENAFAALALAGAAEWADPERMFIEGGTLLDRAGFLAAARAGERAATLLARSFPRSRLGAALAGGGDLEEAALVDRIRRQQQLARVAPVSPAPLLLLVLRRRAEARAIRRAIWRVALETEVAA